MGALSILLLSALLAALSAWLFAERWRLLRPSTRRLVKQGGWRGLSDLSTIHAYVYHRWFDQYVALLIHAILPHVGPHLGDGQRRIFADRYHGKILPPRLAQALILVDRDVRVQASERILPYAQARDLVLSAPPEVAAYECACRRARPNPCQPTRVCMIIGQPYVDFVLEHNPQSSRRLGREEALDLLEAEHRRGHLHAAWFKDACMGRLYAICNCCPCCCGGIEAMKSYGMPALAPSGYVGRVDASRCTGCGACERACPFDAITASGLASIRWEACMGCGVCIDSCPNRALSLALDPRKGEPLDIDELAASTRAS